MDTQTNALEVLFSNGVALAAARAQSTAYFNFAMGVVDEFNRTNGDTSESTSVVLISKARAEFTSITTRQDLLRTPQRDVADYIVIAMFSRDGIPLLDSAGRECIQRPEHFADNVRDVEVAAEYLRNLHWR